VTKASQPAIKAIEDLGGKVTAIYTDPEVIRSILRPEKYAVIPDLVIPPTKRLVAIYSDEARRGYLYPVVKDQERKDIMKSILEKVAAKATN
jgi:large subunit ribosomal protein L15